MTPPLLPVTSLSIGERVQTELSSPVSSLQPIIILRVILEVLRVKDFFVESTEDPVSVLRRRMAHTASSGPLVRPMPIRPPFFIREIYKNGFLKRLPYNERKSSALAKLMKSDRFWVVFSIHDDVHPFLELWHEPTEVASKPPVYVFPLAACQHISPSLIASDSEWSFVINFATAMAIR